MGATMAYHSSPFDASLAFAAGDDPALVADLQQAFAESVTRQVDLIERARCDGNWHVAAERLVGLGASFHAPELVELGKRARAAAPGEPVVLRELRRFADQLTL